MAANLSNNVKPEYEDSDLTSRIIGCAMKTHRTLGCGFPEVIYQRALANELSGAGILFSREFEMPILYNGKSIGTRKVDFLVEERISVELKATSKLEDLHLAQAKNYLECYNLRIGLLINFGSKSLEVKRMINSKAPLVGPQRNQQNQRNPGL